MATPRRSLNIAVNVRGQYYGQTIEKHECFRTNEFSEAELQTEAQWRNAAPGGLSQHSGQMPRSDTEGCLRPSKGRHH